MSALKTSLLLIRCHIEAPFTFTVVMCDTNFDCYIKVKQVKEVFPQVAYKCLPVVLLEVSEADLDLLVATKDKLKCLGLVCVLRLF